MGGNSFSFFKPDSTGGHLGAGRGVGSRPFHTCTATKGLGGEFPGTIFLPVFVVAMRVSSPEETKRRFKIHLKHTFHIHTHSQKDVKRPARVDQPTGLTWKEKRKERL